MHARLEVKRFLYQLHSRVQREKTCEPYKSSKLRHWTLYFSRYRIFFRHQKGCSVDFNTPDLMLSTMSSVLYALRAYVLAIVCGRKAICGKIYRKPVRTPHLCN